MKKNECKKEDEDKENNIHALGDAAGVKMESWYVKIEEEVKEEGWREDK